MKRTLAVLLLAACSSCARRETPMQVSKVTLSGGIVAQVGDVALPASLVASVAGARGISTDLAVRLLIDDALASCGARAKQLDTSSIVARDLTASRARAAAAHVRDVARSTPPTADELEEFSYFRWVEVDLPEQVRVIHAVVLRKPGATGPDDEGSAIARQIANVVAPAADAAQFEKLARDVPHAGRDVRIEELPPFVRDGRVATAGKEVSSMDKTFAAAAFDLGAAGTTSAVVETSFGWHVIRLVERLPPKVVPPEERSAYFAADIYAARARRDLDAVLTAARARARPEINAAAEALMAEVSVATP